MSGLTPKLSRPAAGWCTGRESYQLRCVQGEAAKRVRLERIVRPPLPDTPARLALTQPLSQTVQQVLAGSRASVAGPKQELGARGRELSPRPGRSRPGRSSLAESRACPKPMCSRTNCRCAHRACEMPSAARGADWISRPRTTATTVRETRPNA